MWKKFIAVARLAWIDVRGIFEAEPAWAINLKQSGRGIVLLKLGSEEEANVMEQAGFLERIESAGYMVMWVQRPGHDRMIEVHDFCGESAR